MGRGLIVLLVIVGLGAGWLGVPLDVLAAHVGAALGWGWGWLLASMAAWNLP